MTKQQKLDQVTSMVQELRRWYTWNEVAAMFSAIWQGMDTAKNAAQDTPNENPVP